MEITQRCQVLQVETGLKQRVQVSYEEQLGVRFGLQRRGQPFEGGQQVKELVFEESGELEKIAGVV